MTIRGSIGSLMLQEKSLSLIVAEGQQAATEEQQMLLEIGGAVMSKSDKRKP